jgi:hypothetical protein
LSISKNLCPVVFHYARLKFNPIEVLDESKAKLRKHPSRGTPAKLSNADKLLLLLMYCQEYGTQFHTGVTYGISESRVCEIIKETISIFFPSTEIAFLSNKIFCNLLNK